MSNESKKPGNSGTPRRVTANVQIRLPCATAEDLKERFGAEIAQGAVFIRTKKPKSAGSLLRFDFRYGTGASALRGLANVTESTPEEASTVRPGMLLEIVALELESHKLLRRLGLKLDVPVVKPAPTTSGKRTALGAGPRPPVRPPPPPAPAPPSPETDESKAPEPAAAESSNEQPAPDASFDEPLPLVPTEPTLPPRRPEPAPLPTPTMEQATSSQPPMAAPQAPFPDASERTAPSRSGPIVGIDLGTSNSCVAWMHEGKLQIIPSREGWNTVPSIVAMNNKGRLLVGHPAKSQLLTNPFQTVFGAKRLLGRPFHSQTVTELQERFPYTIVEGPKGEAAVLLGERTYTLQEISALVLREVREMAEGRLGRDISRAVITVPAFYNELQRQAVRDAGELAGIHVEQIVSEPTAAALAFGHAKQKNERILVYDLGGGTFDVSVLELKGNVYEVISTGGDTFLGGVDFDLELLTLMLTKYEQTNGVAFDGDRVALQRLLHAAERAKMALSETTSEHVRVPFVAMHEGKPLGLDCQVTRKEFEAAALPLVERTLQVAGEVLAACKLKPTDIAEVILVGGQSRAPLVRGKLREYFGQEATKSVHPDEAIALGAAALAHAIESQESGGVVLVDVLPMSVGIGLPGGRFKKIIERNAKLPHTVTHTIATTRDNQTQIEFVVFQGESERAVENDYLGSVVIDGLMKAPRGAVKVDITFRLSHESILTVSTRESPSGNETVRELATRDTAQALRDKLSDNAPPPAKTGMFGFLRKLFGNAA